MNRLKGTIIVAEPSPIVSEGLSALLAPLGYKVLNAKGDVFAEIARIIRHSSVEAVILNPQYVQANPDLFSRFINDYAVLRFCALVYSYYEPKLLALFHGVLNIGASQHELEKVLNELASRPREPEEKQVQSLSEREIDVLKLLVAGNSNKEIADVLNISTHTVISHRKNITQKTNIKSVAGLTIYAMLNGVISLEQYQ